MPGTLLRTAIPTAVILSLAAVGLTRIGMAQEEARLRPATFEPLPLGAVKPAGWLKNQLELQAAGFSGQLDAVWPDIKDSAWVGGKAEGWERVPYWLDGLIPLAWQLNDEKLQATCKRYLDYILDHQQPDGWLGPIGDTQKHKPYDVWPLFPLFKAFTQYQEATGDPRIVPALLKAARKIDQVITAEPVYSWAKMRVADLAVPLYWLYEHTEGREPWLLDLAQKAFQQSHDWRAQWDPFKFTAKTQGKFELDTHGVNTAMALKYGAVRWRISGETRDRDVLHKALAGLNQFHGQATGIFTCDEHLAGRSPSQGTELCTVVEAMYSLELTGAITGDTAYFDRLERLAYNALPATFTKDMCAHQYDQQTNQVQCIREGEHTWVNNGPESNLYGLEPNFGCCTANLHQGWPKFVSNLVMKSDQGKGLAIVAYGPCVVETKVQDTPVKLEVVTNYPFRHTAELRVTVPRASAFPINLRIPGWVPTIQTGGSITKSTLPTAASLAADAGVRPTSERDSDAAGEYFRLEGPWSGTTTFTVDLSPTVEFHRGMHNSVALLRGPLVFALGIPAEWQKIKDRPGDLDDYEARPKSPWNYALALDPEKAAIGIAFHEPPMLDGTPFIAAKAPIVAQVQAARVPTWGLEKGAAAPPPQSPVTTREPLETLQLVPYGSTDLRITQFPWTIPTP